MKRSKRIDVTFNDDTYSVYVRDLERVGEYPKTSVCPAYISLDSICLKMFPDNKFSVDFDNREELTFLNALIRLAISKLFRCSTNCITVVYKRNCDTKKSIMSLEDRQHMAYKYGIKERPVKRGRKKKVKPVTYAPGWNVIITDGCVEDVNVFSFKIKKL